MQCINRDSLELNRQTKAEAMDIQNAQALIDPLISDFVGKQFEVLVASACSEDGFVIAHRNGKALKLEEDTIAALSSTLLSLSEAAANTINSGRLRVTLMEAQKANIVVIKTQCRDLTVVLTVAAEGSLSIGQLLFLANRLAGEIVRI